MTICNEEARSIRLSCELYNIIDVATTQERLRGRSFVGCMPNDALNINLCVHVGFWHNLEPPRIVAEGSQHTGFIEQSKVPLIGHSVEHVLTGSFSWCKLGSAHPLGLNTSCCGRRTTQTN
jgi:hypothetical protein